MTDSTNPPPTVKEKSRSRIREETPKINDNNRRRAYNPLPE